MATVSLPNVGHFFDSVTTRLIAFGVPAVLIGACMLVLGWQLSIMSIAQGSAVPVRVWESPGDTSPAKHADTLHLIQQVQPVTVVETRLSTHDFWVLVDIATLNPAQPTYIELPSRHAMAMTCWDAQTDETIGRATRWGTDGMLTKSRAGFAWLHNPGSGAPQAVLCKAAFRGPAQISALAWSPAALKSAQDHHQLTGTLLEAGIGVLALFMLITAVINRSMLHWVLVGWLLLSMRMASLSAGTDFTLFGWTIDPATLIVMRQWTVILCFVMTVAVFSLMFESELRAIKGRWVLTVHQVSAVILILFGLFSSFEQTLPLLWFGIVSIGLLMLSYLFAILRRSHSPVALWYAASIVVTLVASMSEVIAASTGHRQIYPAINSVTAAIVSALLAATAVAQHMRTSTAEKLDAQRTLKAAYEGSPIGLFTLNDDDQIIKCNVAFAQMLHSQDLLGTPVCQLFDDHTVNAILTLRGKPGTVATEIQIGMQLSDGIDRWFAMKLSCVDGKTIEGSLHDITEKVTASSRLEFLVNHDALTACLNLRGIERATQERPHPLVGLAYFDMDRFKVINDLYGHEAGDAVLIQVVERFKQELGPLDLFARIGGDEFVVGFFNTDIAAVSCRCQRMVDAVSQTPYAIDMQRFSLGVSAGLIEAAAFEKSSLKEIIAAADNLCRKAKKRPNEKLVIVDSGRLFLKHQRTELELIACLERGETPEGLYMVMQPEISLTRPFESLNFEILLRMKNKEGDTVPASVIIEAAESHGKSAIIDRWVVTNAIQWIERHATQLSNTRFVGVNLSGGSLNDEAFVEELFDLFEMHRVALSKICLEITETVALTDMHMMQRFIDRARATGAKVGLDDFGAGYSSFGYLKGLSVDALKLDGSLVRGASQTPSGKAIVFALGGLVSNLGMKSIGEFAEDLPTIRMLAAAGVDYAQGYGISKPVNPERILAATSSADFIEDPAILAYITELQTQSQANISTFAGLFGTSDFGAVH